MANLGDKLTIGDREGVVVRSVATAEGLEVTIRVQDENSARPVGAYGLGNEDELPTDPETTDNPLAGRLVDVDKDAAPAPAPAKPAVKSAATKPATPAKGADTK